MHLLHKGIPGTEITGTVRRLQRSYATVKSVLPGYLSRAETACGEGISQEIVKERKVQTTNRANSFANRESSSFLIITHVWKHNEVSESGLIATPSAGKPRAAGLVRMATPTCSDTK